MDEKQVRWLTSHRFRTSRRVSRKPGSVRCGLDVFCMAQNFGGCDRDQVLLLPPSLSERLPEDLLAWFVLAAVEELDLGAFYGAYREDGWGRAAHDPSMMVARLLYACSIGVRSARAIERRCREDVAFRVICANQTPDHATIARFRARHEDAISGLFGAVLELCARAGLVRVAEGSSPVTLRSRGRPRRRAHSRHRGSTARQDRVPHRRRTRGCWASRGRARAARIAQRN